MINKNDYRKINDKKILHKSGKTWKVVSLALLLAIGGGAAVAATNNNASANATDNAYNDAQGVTSDTAAQAEQLENNSYYGGSAKASVAPKSTAKSVAAPSFANINYAPSEYYAGNNASAASYKNNESYDNANINYYGPIVRGYVDQINAKYPQARSLEDNYDNLQGKTNEAQSAANSYSATAQNSNTANVINSMAAKTNQTASNFVDSVAYNVLNNNSGFMPRVSNAAQEASQDSVVASYANLIYDINNNPVLSEEYSAKALEAEAQSSVTSAYASNDADYVTQLTYNSSANNDSLVANIQTSITLSAREEVAKINSGNDANFVSSAASNAGFKYSSSVASSVVSAIASEDNSFNSSVGNLLATNNIVNPASVNAALNNKNNASYFNSQVSNNNDDVLSFKENGQTSSYSVDFGESAGIYAEKTGYNASALALIFAVSDTATQSEYDALNSGLNSNIAVEKSNQASYANAISAANDALNKAKNSSASASSAYQAAYVLGNKPNDYDIFNQGSNVVGSTTTASYNSANLQTDEQKALSDAGITNSSFSGNNASSEASNYVKGYTTKVSNAISALSSNLSSNNSQSLIASSDTQSASSAAQYIDTLKTAMKDGSTVPGGTTQYSDLDKQVLSDLSNNQTQNAEDIANDINDNANINALKAAMDALFSSNTETTTVSTSGALDTSRTVNHAIAVDIINAVTKQNNKNGLSDKGSNNVTIADTSTKPSTIKDNIDGAMSTVISDLQAAVHNNKPYSITNTAVYKNMSANDQKLLEDAGFNINSHNSTVNDAVNAAKTALTTLNNYNNDVNGNAVSTVNNVNVYEAPILNAASYSNVSNGLAHYLATDGNFNYSDTSDASSVASDVASTAVSAGSNYKSVSSASASYAQATDQDVTIASQFNSYYNSIASSDATLASAAKASLMSFRATHASNPEAYTSASDAYANAAAAKPNDRDFAYAYGKNVLLNTPEYITVTKNAMLHNDTQYAKSNAVESVKAGTQFAVKGVGFDLAGNVRYVVADAKGKNLYITGNDQYVRNTYLAPSVDYTVTLAKPAVAHNTLGFIKDAEGTIPANTQLEGYTVPTSTNSGRRDAAYGVTRLQVKGGKFNGDYITTNGKYFSNVTENNSNNNTAAAQNTNPVQNTINFAD